MALKLSPAMKAIIMDEGVHALSGRSFDVPYDAQVAWEHQLLFTNAEPAVLTVHGFDGEHFATTLAEPMRVTMAPPITDVRCPKCGKKLGESLQGTYTTKCPRCKERVTITR